MRGPLEGIRVFDLTLLMVGPWSTMNLGALGADVIHIERPGIADSSLGGGVPPSINGTSVGHITWNMNKRQLFLDLKEGADLEVAKRLIATCDVFVNNMRPGVAERLGLGYEDLCEINPRLVYCAICGWGDGGPLAERTATDPQLQAFTGFASNSGVPGGRAETYRHFTQLDATTGNYATMAILMALIARERTGRGQRIDLTMVEAATAVQATKIGEYLATGEHPPLLGSATSTVAPSEAFRCEDGTHIGVQAATAQQWRSLCEALGLGELAADPRFATIAGRVAGREEVAARLASVFATKPARWWQLRLGRAGVPCARVMRFDELVHHPQVTENHYIEPVETEAYGTVYATGLPWAFSRTPASILPTARAGQHTGEILDELDALTPEPAVGRP
jgi:crotonobetainyl-CoA:carnitine CoA-transferase CaiB-like acyl-CoA transferase